MTFRRFILVVFIFVAIVLWWNLQSSNPTMPKLQLAQHPGAKIERSYASMKAEEAERETPFIQPLNRILPLPMSKIHDSILAVRAQKAQAYKTESYGSYHERLDAKATPWREYHSSLGAKLENVGGYTVYETQPERALNNFDGKNLPVVVDHHGRMGVVNGDIRVVFKTYPQNIDQFASAYDVHLVRGEKAFKTAFFTLRQVPADIVARVEVLKTNESVKDASLDIIFRAPVAQ